MVKLRVRVGNAEVEIEAESEKLNDVVNIIPTVIEKIRQNASQHPEQVTNEKRESTLPLINIEKQDSLTDIIGKLFSNEWGFSERKLLDVREALKTYGLNYPKQSVAVALLRLAKAGKIRRFKTEGGDYAYISSTLPAGTSFLKEQDLSNE